MTNINLDLIDQIKLTPLIDTVKILKIDDEEYFSSKYHDYISNSRLGLLNPEQDGSPEKFFGKSVKEYSPSLEIGTIIHELFLQRDYYTLVNDVDKPTGKTGIMADYMYDKHKNTGEEPEKFLDEAIEHVNFYHGSVNNKQRNKVLDSCSEYWDKRETFEFFNNSSTFNIYTDPRTRERATGCINSLYLNYDITDLLYPRGNLQTPLFENEEAILIDYNVEIPESDPFVFHLKAKLDNYTIDNETRTITVNDLKTIGKHVSVFNENIQKYHYFREVALYLELLSLTGNYIDYNKKSNFLVVSTIPPHQTRVVRITKEELDLGLNEAMYLLKLAALYYNNGYRFE